MFVCMFDIYVVIKENHLDLHWTLSHMFIHSKNLVIFEKECVIKQCEGIALLHTPSLNALFIVALMLDRLAIKLQILLADYKLTVKHVLDLLDL